MNDRPYPRALVEACGDCPGCFPCAATFSPVVCPVLLEDVEQAMRTVEVRDFYRRVAAELAAEVPEVLELRRIYERGAPLFPRAQEG